MHISKLLTVKATVLLGLIGPSDQENSVTMAHILRKFRGCVSGSSFSARQATFMKMGLSPSPLTKEAVAGPVIGEFASKWCSINVLKTSPHCMWSWWMHRPSSILLALTEKKEGRRGVDLDFMLIRPRTTVHPYRNEMLWTMLPHNLSYCHYESNGENFHGIVGDFPKI